LKVLTVDIIKLQNIFFVLKKIKLCNYRLVGKSVFCTGTTLKKEKKIVKLNL